MENKKIKKPSPMMQHYLTVKERYPDAIIFYRLGDFYEMFNEDAIECSRVLDLTLTGKDCGMQERAPMCGIPFHSAETYIKRLIENNYKVAICEQLTEATKGKGIVERDVIRVITPGTVTEDSILEDKKNNYIASVYYHNNSVGITYSDISTGEFYVTEFFGDDFLSQLKDLLTRISPSEIICNKEALELEKLIEKSRLTNIQKFEAYNDYSFDYERSESNLNKQFGDNCLFVFDINKMKYAISSSGALLDYLNDTQKRMLAHINKIFKIANRDYMTLDLIARRNLEIDETMRDRKRKGSLLWILDETKTPMGARMFKTWLDQPLNNSVIINNRLDSVEELVSKYIVRDKLSQILSGIYDIERLVSKLATGNFTPKNCISLKDSLYKLPKIKELLSGSKTNLLKNIENEISDYTYIAEKIDKMIVSDNTPNSTKDGGYIKSGCNAELDEYRSALINGKNWISKLEAKEREETGIKQLKISYNRVFGYYIEVTKNNLSNVPLRYIRKQTLANNERYITDELKDIEDKILNAEELSLKLESAIFDNLKEELMGHIVEFQKISKCIAVLDSLYSLATVAVKYNYCKPKINNNIKHIKIDGGRHPVVEAMLKNEQFIVNDTFLNNDEDKMIIITGPNMAGKSTYMRQVALITLMAHIGSFVPATSAEISITDRIFTRVGASDDLSFGQSTFMVEMTEVANIVQNATEKSLVILDEIGRGTSTFDGLSIAWAVVEHMCQQIGAKTLFATHYHELTELERYMKGVKNYKISVKEYNDTIVFLRKIVRGGANKSFGIEVASLAGIPQEIVNRAKKISLQLEKCNPTQNLAIVDNDSQPDDNFKKDNSLEIISILSDVNMERVSPMVAFDILNDLVQKLKG